MSAGRPMKGPVRLDQSRRTVVALCGECPPWRVLRASKPAALRAAATHVDQVHEDADLASHFRELAARQDKRDTPKP